MKSITISRESFLSASSKAITFIEKKIVIPIYGCYRLDFDGLFLTITASRGGNHQIQVNCQASGDPFSVCVNAGMLHNITSALLESDVTFQFPESKGHLKHLRIQDKGIKHDLPIFPAEEFFVLPVPEKKNSFSIRGSIFTGMGESAASLVEEKRNEMYPQYAGINICTHKDHPGSLIMQGGVSHSFSVCEYPNSGVGDFEAATVDKQCVQNMSDLIQDHEDVNVWHDGTRIIISSPTVSISTRLLVGKFPDMVGLLSRTKSEGRLRFNMGEMGYALKRLGYHKTKDEVGIIVIAISDAGTMDMVLDNNEQGSIGDEQVQVTGSPINCTIGFDIDVFSAGLKAARAITVEMGYTDEKKPIIITPAESEDNRWNASIMLAASVISKR